MSNPLGAHIAISPDYVIARMRLSDRALLPREIAPTPHPGNVVQVVTILQRLRREGRVRFNGQTDRWSVM